jgi:hypothetical protein
MQNTESVRYVQIGMLCFVFFLILCILIRPGGLNANSGVSYYGGFIDTLVPYALCFLSMGMAVWFSTLSMQQKTEQGKYLKFAFKSFAILLIGLLFTPHTIVGNLHKVFGSTLFASQLLLALYLVINNKFVFKNYMLLTLAFLSGLASALYLGSENGYLLQTQVIFQLMIWWLYIRILKFQTL